MISRVFLAFLLFLSTAALSTPTVRVNGKLKGTGLLHKPSEQEQLGMQFSTLDGCDTLPPEFDLRDFGVVPPIKDQGQCGSCWAFSMTGSLESAHAASGEMLNLSEQQLVSCDNANFGCGGGNLNGFDYQIKTGQALETAFPYTGSNSRCKSGLAVTAKGTSYANVGASGRRATEKEVMCALYKSHTIPWITVSAGGGNWSSPPTADDGVFSRCGSGQTNHAVGLIGWKTINGKVYMKMRNSWGASWGSTAGKPGAEKGFALMPLGCDSLGEEVSYIITDAMPCKPPVVKLPAETIAAPGIQVMLGVQEQQGVDYEWFVDGVSVAHGAMAFFAPDATTVYKLIGKNACGQSESSSKITISP